jgi:hypothetical protein
MAKTLAALETISCAQGDLRDHLVRIYAKTHEAAGAALPFMVGHLNPVVLLAL